LNSLLARLNEEYPASRYSTAWVLDEFGVPCRRAGGNIGNEATPAPAKREPLEPLCDGQERQSPSRSFDRAVVRAEDSMHKMRDGRRRRAAKLEGLRP
jgi:hypothetical protein